MKAFLVKNLVFVNKNNTIYEIDNNDNKKKLLCKFI